MATISEIVSLEAANRDRIYLHLEGIFWKAYQRSAYLFVNEYNKYKILKKYVKAVKQEIVVLGFPQTQLLRLFPEESICRINGKLLYIKGNRNINENEYETWFGSISEKINETAHTVHTAHVEKTKATEPLNKNKEWNIMMKLREFRLEVSTPMECMHFVNELKNELKN